MRRYHFAFLFAVCLGIAALLATQAKAVKSRATESPVASRGQDRAIRTTHGSPRMPIPAAANETESPVLPPARTKSKASKASHAEGTITSHFSPSPSPSHFPPAPDAEVTFISPDPSAPGIQLAENVRLPAILIPPQDMTGGAPATRPPAVEAAAREITNQYYRDLGERAGAGGHDTASEGLQADVPAVSRPTGETAAGEITPPYDPDAGKGPEPGGPYPTGEEFPAGARVDNDGAEEPETIVLEPGPDTDDPRRMADEAFRAVFGEAAYNRHAIDSGIEVNLTPVTGAGSN